MYGAVWKNPGPRDCPAEAHREHRYTTQSAGNARERERFYVRLRHLEDWLHNMLQLETSNAQW
ncbi:hypothetical protein, partial [Nocardia cyriacigeorgica]|uniref:hypothetical protein n=1 Tax=Nocardia cyriacigeorgica TaxID=135487 RepID=UPI002458EA9E